MSARFKTAPVAAPAPGRLSTVLWAGLEQRRNAPRNTAPEGVYPDSDREWTNRLELVSGGCSEETTCYDNWNAAFIARILENPMANTIVLLSVGAGVLELRSIEAALQVRDETATPIKNIWLIDPGVDDTTGGEVASQYAARLDGVDVTYFTDTGAYDKAIKTLRESPDTRVATIGALNTSFGLLGAELASIARYNAMLKFVHMLADGGRRGHSLHVVQAWHNDREGYKVLDEQAYRFMIRKLELVSMMEREMYIQRASRNQAPPPLGMHAMDQLTDNGGHGTAASAVPRGVP